MRRRAFSLVELAAVLVILAITAAAMTLHVRTPLRRLGLRGCLDAVTDFDRLARVTAREQDRPLRLVVELAEGRLRRTDVDGREDLGPPLVLPEGYRLAAVRLGARALRSGVVTLSCSRRGLGSTYALQIEGPDDETRWLVFAGLTGRPMETDAAAEVEAVFGAIGAGDNAR